MNMTRRSLLGAILAAAVAPPFVRSGSLMVPRKTIWTPPEPERKVFKFAMGESYVLAFGASGELVASGPVGEPMHFHGPATLSRYELYSPIGDLMGVFAFSSHLVKGESLIVTPTLITA